MSNASTADYDVQPETITEEHRFTCPFIHNELVEILDAQGRPTGERGYFFAQEVDLWNEPTGRAAVSLVHGANIYKPFSQLRSVKH
jgi:hypothetical protein